MNTILPSLMTIIGVIIGAFIQFYFSRKKTLEEKRIEQKTKAYTIYLEGIGTLSVAAKSGSVEMQNVGSEKLMVGRGSISIYGSSEVVEALAKFEKEGGQLTSDTQAKCFIDLVHKMRNNVNSEIVSERDLSYIYLFKNIYKNKLPTVDEG